MDLTRQQQQQTLASACRGGPPPFPRRPWMSETGLAAAAAASGNLGLKGVIAGMLLRLSLSIARSRARDRARDPPTYDTCLGAPRHAARSPTATAETMHRREPTLFFFPPFSFWSRCTPANRTITRRIARSRSRAIACVCMCVCILRSS